MEQSRRYFQAQLRRLRQRGASEAEQAAAARALNRMLLDNAEVTSELTAAGVIPALVRCLQRGSSNKLLQMAAVLMYSLARDSDTCNAAAPSIPALVRCLQRGSTHEMLATAAASVLFRFAIHGYGAAIAAAGAIPLLLSVLRSSSNETVQKGMLLALKHLAAGSPAICADIEAAGGVPDVGQCMQRNTGQAVLEMAAGTLLCLTADNHPERCTAAAAAGGIDVLVHCLGSAHSHFLRQQAASTLVNLTCHSEDRIAGLAAAGAIPCLVLCLAQPHQSETATVEASLQRRAAILLHNLACCNQGHGTAIQAAGGIQALQDLQLRSPDEETRVVAAKALEAVGEACTAV